MGCYHNVDGICTNENEDFLLNIFDKIRLLCEENDNIISDLSANIFKCNPTIEYNTCEHCGTPLSYTDDYVPYSTIHTKLRTWHCPNCD